MTIIKTLQPLMDLTIESRNKSPGGKSKQVQVVISASFKCFTKVLTVSVDEPVWKLRNTSAKSDISERSRDEYTEFLPLNSCMSDFSLRSKNAVVDFLNRRHDVQFLQFFH
eukprot:Lithocolla_globosa_v1_NODE_3845_length_1566_cov_2.780940.p4 type:complete len:111 gc:universal NODE_3845_length_1566_cov_2.780940:921-1253(+)